MLKSPQEAQSEINSIVGVELKVLQTFPDDRGFFREVIRKTDDFFAEGFAQWSHSKMGKNTVKAWHFHHRQVDWWYCPIGTIHVALIDFREESSSFEKKIEFQLGDEQIDANTFTTVVKIPPGVLHGCRVLSEQAHLFYVTSRVYDPDDEGRYPFNSEQISHNWGDEQDLTVAANDRRLFVPPYPREKISRAR